MQEGLGARAGGGVERVDPALRGAGVPFRHPELGREVGTDLGGRVRRAGLGVGAAQHAERQVGCADPRGRSIRAAFARRAPPGLRGRIAGGGEGQLGGLGRGDGRAVVRGGKLVERELAGPRPPGRIAGVEGQLGGLGQAGRVAVARGGEVVEGQLGGPR